MGDRRITYLLHVVPGLESVAAREIVQVVPARPEIRALLGFDERSSLLAVSLRRPADHLLTLRTVEDVFALVVDHPGIPWSYAGLRIAREAVESSETLDAAAALALESQGRPVRRPSFRVIARAAGEHAFRRSDLRDAVERAIIKRYPAWRLVEDGGHVEIWAHLVHDHLVVGVRLSRGSLRYRTYKQANIPASLKPTVAAAMVLVSQPRPDDTVLDPMCGAGTLLIERGDAARYRRLLGGDFDPAAVDAARVNIGPRYQPIELRHWNARSLPLEDQSVDAVLCNLPFGRRIGSEAENRALYPALLGEWARVLRPDGRMVLLSSESRLLDAAVAKHRPLAVMDRIPVLLRGLPSVIHLIAPRSTVR